MHMQAHGGRLSRRAFVGGLAGLGTLVAGLAVTSGWVLTSRSARPPIAKIGVLSAGAYEPNMPALVGGLRSLGWVEGDNLAIEWRLTEGRADALPVQAAELVRLGVDVIVAVASVPASAARDATSTIPIIFVIVGDPVAIGLVSSMSHPGGNLTGPTGSANILAPKQLQLLKEAVPTISRIGVLVNSASVEVQSIQDAIRKAASDLDLGLDMRLVRDLADLDSALAAFRSAGVDGLLAGSGSVMLNNQARIVDFVVEQRLPAMLSARQGVVDGGLMYYGSPDTAQFRRAAAYVDKVLRGAKPSDLPVELPSQFDFVVNVTTARALGLTIPPHVAAQVTEWVE
jgi:ABC-type uncharacterized transport system substrate-binding protein